MLGSLVDDATNAIYRISQIPNNRNDPQVHAASPTKPASPAQSNSTFYKTPTIKPFHCSLFTTSRESRSAAKRKLGARFKTETGTQPHTHSLRLINVNQSRATLANLRAARTSPFSASPGVLQPPAGRNSGLGSFAVAQRAGNEDVAEHQHC